MVKYCGHYITFQEVPNEVALVFPISNCPYRCEGCHSPWLQTDIGDELTPEVIVSLLDKYQGAVTCVCFMGDGGDPFYVGHLVFKASLWGVKTCVYTGETKDIAAELMFPDYLKTGPYIESLGGLNSPRTNQHMFKVDQDGNYHDITSWFWRKKE